MKKTKIIIPALGMLLLSTAASVTGTVAWFSMSNYVTATNMNITAKAENGIVISNEAKSDWKETITASHTSAIAVRPVSTVDGSLWVHSTSNDANLANTSNRYAKVTPVLDATTGAGYVEDNNVANYQKDANTTQEPYYDADSTYYLLNSFYIQSSAEALTKTIYVTNVTVSAGNNPGSAALDAALRVLIKSGDDYLIYAPYTGATLTYNAVDTLTEDNPATTEQDEYAEHKTSVTAINPNAAAANGDPNPGKDKVLLSNQTIPAFDSVGATSVKIDVYLYFEGEDAQCKSANLVTPLDNLNVSVKFGTAQEYPHA